MYDILEGGGAVRTRSYPGPTPALLYRTCTPQKRGPQVGPPCLTHTHNTANAEHHGGEGVVGGFAAERRLSEAPVAAAAEY